MLTLLTSLAAAQNFQSPNSTIAVSGGSPSALSLRGEAWLGASTSGEIGVGLPADQLTNLFGDESGAVAPIFDWALRWRPKPLCFGCGQRALISLGVGLGGTVTPDLELVGPWTYSAGLDLAGTGVYWFSPTFGLQATLRAGGGPQWVGPNLDEPEPAVWLFGGVGLAF
ncbi:MAG: hypothetical protein KTR31_17925 [Myxococcales bacterium]|nr:hypothetical protein [Myxococcales bacterium]